MSYPLYEGNMLLPLKNRDDELKKMWEDLEDIPMNPDTECIEKPFLHFPVGTPREEIWSWFDERHSKGVAYLLYHTDARTNEESKMTMLRYYDSLCDDCDSMSCVYNDGGSCRYPMVHHRVPIITEENGCESGVIDAITAE